MARLRIAIASAGRFHVLDLACELHRLGHSVRFYSYVPARRAVRFGLPRECHISLFLAAAPVLAWGRLAPRLATSLREKALYAALNRAVIARLQPCDVIIGMSGIYLEALEHARTRFGARVWLERGSRHILSQDEILAGLPGAQRPSPFVIARELAGYGLADRIVVPSRHVAESFERDPEAHAKLFLNPYGVDQMMFPMRSPESTDSSFRLLNVGGWSHRKGAHVLADAVSRTGGVRLQHVGAILDADFPENSAKFVHSPPVPQHRLTELYAQADAVVLPSLEDGFGLVLVQALASGLPVICSDRTGGAELAHTSALADRITVVPHGDVAALAAAIEALGARLRNGPPMVPLADSDLKTLSWSAYGRRYDAELLGDVTLRSPSR